MELLINSSSFILKLMPEREERVSIQSNNSEIEKIFLLDNLHPELHFVKKSHQKIPYHIFFIDINNDLNHISHSLIEEYANCVQKDIKLAVVVMHGSSIDIEKNHYFQKMLDSLGKDRPIHRLIFTKDIYHYTTQNPATSFDKYLKTIVDTREISISKRGENKIYPLSQTDLIKAIIKSLFLSGTAGKIFWILGDPINDLELSYLLKKKISSINKDDLEINALENDDPKLNSLQSIGNKSRAELNWQPEEDFVNILGHIVSQYSEKPNDSPVKNTKLNPLHKFINWLYKPRQKKTKHLPTVHKILKQIILLFIVTNLVIIGGVVIATGISLKYLETSINKTLDGKITESVASLEKSKKFKEVGESLVFPYLPVMNLVAHKETSKIVNLFNFIDYSTLSLTNVHHTYVIAENILFSINNAEDNLDYKDLSLALQSNLGQIYENINQIMLLKSGGKLPKLIEKKIEESSEFKEVSFLESQITQYLKLADLIPEVLSSTETKKIAVLLQNSNMLRPAGGKVDYYLLITLDQGKIISKKYISDLELENQYLQIVEEEKNDRRNVEDQEINFTDLAKTTDFNKQSLQLSQLLEKTQLFKPDIIIATNEHLITQIMSQENSEYIEKFKGNMLQSTGSENYRQITDQYLERLINKDLKLSVVGRTLAKMIGENQILFWSSDVETQRMLAAHPYSGVISLHPCNAGIVSSQKCLAQTTYLAESRLTGQRSNPWSKRQQSHKIDILSDIVKHEYTIEYEEPLNSEVSEEISFIYNLYLPSPSNLDQVLLNNLPSSLKDVVKTQETAFDRYEIPVVIKSNSGSVLTIKSSTLVSTPFSVPFSYSITEYHQPGVIDNGVSLAVNYPSNLRPSIATSDFTAEPSQMKLSLPPHTTTFGFTLVGNQQ